MCFLCTWCSIQKTFEVRSLHNDEKLDAFRNLIMHRLLINGERASGSGVREAVPGYCNCALTPRDSGRTGGYRFTGHPGSNMARRHCARGAMRHGVRALTGDSASGPRHVTGSARLAMHASRMCCGACALHALHAFALQCVPFPNAWHCADCAGARCWIS